MNTFDKKKWEEVVSFFEKRVNQPIELEGMLLLVGIQELGFVPQKLNKKQKLEVMHIAVCTLLEPYGYYKYIGRDEDKWPHYERTEKIPFLKNEEQDYLIRQAMYRYYQTVLQ